MRPLQPYDGSIFLSLGIVLTDLGQVRYAVQAFARATQLLPDDPQAHYRLGRALITLGYERRALQAWQRAVELDGKWQAARYDLGVLYLKQEHYARAIEHFEAVLQQEPDDLDAAYFLAIAYKETGRSGRDGAVAGARGRRRPARPLHGPFPPGRHAAAPGQLDARAAPYPPVRTTEAARVPPTDHPRLYPGIGAMTNDPNVTALLDEMNRLPTGEAGAATATTGPAVPLRRVLGMRSGDELYGIDIESITEISKLTPVTFVPGAPAYILGVTSLRGQIVPVVNLRGILGVDPESTPWKKTARAAAQPPRPSRALSSPTTAM